MQFHPNVMGQVAEGEQIVGIVKRHAFLKVQALARQDFFGNRQQGGVFDLEAFRNHGQVVILPGRDGICNWPRLKHFDCDINLALRLLGSAQQTRMNTGGGLTTGL